MKYKIILSEDGQTFEELRDLAISSLVNDMHITKSNVSEAILLAILPK